MSHPLRLLATRIPSRKCWSDDSVNTFCKFECYWKQSWKEIQGELFAKEKQSMLLRKKAFTLCKNMK